MRHPLLFVCALGLLWFAFCPVRALAQQSVALSDVSCTVSTFDMCHVEVELVGELSADSAVFIGFSSGCIGYTGTPQSISPGQFVVSLSYSCYQSPFWLTPDLWVNYGEPDGYPCFEELGVAVCSDSTNWWVHDAGGIEHWYGYIAESFVPFQQSFDLVDAMPMNVVSGGPDLCGEGTFWNPSVNQCVSDLDAAVPFCGPGTTWDPLIEACIVTIPADVNLDGCITVNDLLSLLAVHGTCPD